MYYNRDTWPLFELLQKYYKPILWMTIITFNLHMIFWMLQTETKYWLVVYLVNYDYQYLEIHTVPATAELIQDELWSNDLFEQFTVKIEKLCSYNVSNITRYVWNNVISGDHYSNQVPTHSCYQQLSHWPMTGFEWETIN